MRLVFILTVHLYATPANPGEIFGFLLCKMRLGFILTINLYVNLANPGEIVVWFLM